MMTNGGGALQLSSEDLNLTPVVRKYSVRFVNGRLQGLRRIEPCNCFLHPIRIIFAPSRNKIHLGRYITNTLWRESPHDSNCLPKAAESVFCGDHPCAIAQFPKELLFPPWVSRHEPGRVLRLFVFLLYATRLVVENEAL